MMCSKPKIFSLVLDTLLFSSIGLGLVICVFGPISPPYTFVSCDDPSIRRPYGKSTVNDVMLIGTSILAPLLMLIALEWAISSPSDGSSPLRQGLQSSWKYYKHYFIGLLFTYCFTELLKITSGEARPYFWSVCSPNITDELCQQTIVKLSWRDCTNPLGLSRRKVVNSMKSFPSGHASMSVYSAVYMIVYIKKRLWNRCSVLLAPWLQLLWITWAVVCSQSRIWDDKHHWWDVVAGCLIGIIGALLTVHITSQWFKCEENSESSEKEALTSDLECARTNSRSSYASVKRLISTTSETNNHADHRLDNRELSDINGTP